MNPPAGKPPAPLATVVEEGFQAWLWLDARIEGFPVSARRQMGHRILDALLDALTATTEASYCPRGQERLALLRLANRRLAVARILLRGARERRHLSVGHHDHAVERLGQWGRQLGGWIKSDQSHLRSP